MVCAQLTTGIAFVIDQVLVIDKYGSCVRFSRGVAIPVLSAFLMWNLKILSDLSFYWIFEVGLWWYRNVESWDHLTLFLNMYSD